MTVQECNKIIAILSSFYPQASFTPDAGEAWHMLFHDLPFETVRDALPGIMSANPVFCPNAPQISNWVRERKDGLPTLDQVYDEIFAAIKKVGSWGYPTFSHPIITRTVNAMGWLNICQTPLTQMDTLRAHIRDVYQSAKGGQVEKITYQPFNMIGGEHYPELSEGDDE